MTRLLGLSLLTCLLVGCTAQKTDTIAPSVSTGVENTTQPASDTAPSSSLTPGPTTPTPTAPPTDASTRALDSEKAAAPAATSDPATPASTAPAASTPAAPAAAPSASAGNPVRIEAGVATLSPENTKIIFVGTHHAEKPDPRTGGFEKFTGKVEIDEAAKKVKSVVVDIDANSIWTEFQKLTDHLKSPDFFEVREHPTLKFESSSIESGADGQTQIRGNLTLHGVTKEIEIPATVQINDQGLSVTSKFEINRTDFGMKFGTDKVDDKVTLTVVVGEKTSPTRAPGPGA